MRSSSTVVVAFAAQVALISDVVFIASLLLNGGIMSTGNRIHPVIHWIKTGLLFGLGYGLTVCIVHLIIGVLVTMAMGVAPMTLFCAKTLLIEPLIAVVVGTLISPIFYFSKGRYIHPALMAVIWVVCERVVAIDPAKVGMWLMPPVLALLFFYGFWRVWRKKHWVVYAVAVIMPVLALLLPVLRFNAIGGYDVPQAHKIRNAPKDAPDVVFVVMDTVRARNVSAYGYERKTTPVFDAFAKEGALFENATAPGTWSLASHASLFTGTVPSVHGAHGESNYLDDKLPTLAQVMTESGFDTQCFTANSYISSGFGLTRGFNSTDKAWLAGEGARGFAFIYRLVDLMGFMPEDKGGNKVIENVRDWMANRPEDGPPAFVFVNFLEAHFPAHQLPDKFRNAFTDEPISKLRQDGQLAFGVQLGRQLSESERDRISQPILDLYDGGIKYTDYLLGKIIDIWKQRGTLDNTIFVVLGDHGEHVGEHKTFGHMLSVYQEDLAVPFMFRYPSQIKAGKRVSQTVSTLGVFATLFDLLGMTPPDSVQWGSLLPLMNSDASASHPIAAQPVIAERYEKKLIASRFDENARAAQEPLNIPFGRYRVYRVEKYKYVQHYENGTTTKYLFDLEKDPGELTNLATNPAYKLKQLEIEESVKHWKKELSLSELGAQQPGDVRSADVHPDTVKVSQVSHSQTDMAK